MKDKVRVRWILMWTLYSVFEHRGSEIKVSKAMRPSQSVFRPGLWFSILEHWV